MDIKDKVVLVTGGATGLGLSITKALLKEGSIVHVVTRNIESYKNDLTEIDNGKLFSHQGDVTSYEQIKNLISEIGDIDILINNAGVWIEGSLIDNDPEKISEAIDINTKGVIYTTKAVLPMMLKKDSGYIFNISSTSGVKAKENQTVYCASKFAVQGFTDALKEDLKNSKIKVSAFYPGGMNTKLFEKAGSGRDTTNFMSTETIASLVVFMLKLEQNVIISNVTIQKRNA